MMRSEIFKENPGFVKTMWCENDECEDKLKADTGATIRCIPFEQEHIRGYLSYVW